MCVCADSVRVHAVWPAVAAHFAMEGLPAIHWLQQKTAPWTLLGLWPSCEYVWGASDCSVCVLQFRLFKAGVCQCQWLLLFHCMPVPA